MKIVFTISQLGGGGAERVVTLLSGKLSELGHDVSLITLLKRKIVYPLNPNVNLIELNCKNSRFFGSVEQIKALHKCYVSEKPNVIVSFLPVVNMTAILAKSGVGCKIIVSERNDPYQNPRKKVVRMMRDFLYRFSDGFVFQTKDAQDYFGKYAQSRGIVIANPLAENLPEPFCGTRRKVFVSAVRLEPQKNLEMLIDAFAKFSAEYKDYTLEIYGEGPQRDLLERKIAKLGLENRVFLKGFSKQVHQQIRDAAAFVLPSNYEGMSNSMLEALALGVPVISTDHPIGGARMFIENGVNGILTRVGDTEEMHQALRFAAENPSKMQWMARNAERIREIISGDNIVHIWVNYIEQIYQ